MTVDDQFAYLTKGCVDIVRAGELRAKLERAVSSKTPLINRLFRNVGISRTSRSLMLMVTPRIVILEEEEERLGIPSTTPAAL